MIRSRRYFAFFLCIAFFSCKEAPKKEIPLVQLTQAPASQNSSLPYLYSHNGITLLSWVEHINDSTSSLKFSEMRSGVWEKPQTIISGNDWFVNWADFPAIVENNGHLFSHLLKKSSKGTYSYDVKMNLKPKDSLSWQTNLVLHTDGTATEHGFVSAVPYKEDSFFVTWLDGRNTEEKKGEERGAMTIRAAIVSSTGAISDDTELDARTCDCCQTTAAITKNGPVVVYRDRSDDEIRDISIVRKVGDQWTTPKPIYNDQWKIKGCPVNGPKAAAIDNTLAVAWFTAADNKPMVKVAFSVDGGENFEAPIPISEINTVGRVDIALLDRDTAVVSYMDSKEGSAQIKAVKVSRSGEKSDAIVIADLDASRKTGFPQMELVDDTLYFAWTSLSEGTSQVKTAFVQKNRFQ